jgi:folate-binding protein YgfZ
MIDLGRPAEFKQRGPDAVRFLNGQLTQDVRRVAGGGISLPSCVTDAKGKLQFRVTLSASDGNVLWVCGIPHAAADLEARLTRYLIADDVDVADLTGNFGLWHLMGDVPEPPDGGIGRKSNRFGEEGVDWWIPSGIEMLSGNILGGEELEALRISNGIPAWGHELVEGLLPPEAGLDLTDVSYNKGCYIGQEVISRIKSAGKVNKRLTRFVFAPDIRVVPGPLENGAGEITSVSPELLGGVRHALGYVKRGATDLFLTTAGGKVTPVRVA